MGDTSDEGKTQPCKKLSSFSLPTECFSVGSILSGVLGSFCGLGSALRLRSFPLIQICSSLVVNLPADHVCPFLTEVVNTLFHCFFFIAADFTLIKPCALQTISFL